MRSALLAAALLVLQAGCAERPAGEAAGKAAGVEPADIVFTGGVVHTADEQRSRTEAVAVRGDTIVAVGSTAEVNAWIGEVNRGARGRGAPEMWLFNHAIAPWQPAESIAITKLMAVQLSSHLQDEVLRARLGRGVMRELRRETKREHRWRARLGMTLIGVFGVAFVVVLAAQLGFALSGPRIVSGEVGLFDRIAEWLERVFLPVVSVSAVMMLIGSVWFGQGHARARGRALVRLGRCGSCLYELEGLLAEGDGCCVCPECGAAWRLPSGDGSNDPDPAGALP